MRLFAWPILFLALLGCQRPDTTAGSNRAPIEPLPPDPWILATNDPGAEEPAWLSNGLIGIRLSRGSTGYGSEGQSLPFFHADEYDADGEEKIRQLPNPLSLVIDDASNEFAGPNHPQDYRQELDMRTGVLSSSWKEKIKDGSVSVKSQTVIHPSDRILAQRWELVPDRDADLSAGPGSQAGMDWKPVREDKSERETVFDMEGLGPSRLKWSVRWRQRSGGTTGSEMTPKGQPYVVETTWTFGRSPQFVEIMKARGIALKLPADFFDPPKPPTFEEVASASKNAWKERWKTDIEIDGPVEDQQAVRSMLFYLCMAANPEAPVSLPPLALSGTQYNGHVFWDADVWVFPSLAFVAPDLARAIPDYRIALADQARKNFEEWVKAGRPTASGKIGPLNAVPKGLMYPWESSVSGKETVPGPSKWEHHITGSVLHGLQQASALGLAKPEVVDQLKREAAAFYLARSVSGPNGREIQATMSPDEHHTGDNDLYTNLLAEWLTGEKFKRPRDQTSLLTYDGDTIKGYKQAAAVLSIFPLQDPEAEKLAKTMMDRFGDKVIKNGPAMSDSVHAVIWSRLGETEKAYDAWTKSWKEFTKHPLFLFSEKRSNAVTYFVTGAGGSLQSVVYGFLGFRIDSSQSTAPGWSTRLMGERWLNVQPHLPKAWKSVRFKNFHVLGRSYTLTATQTSVKVTQGD
jgi:trehalose/maltose hydrolase-like predicted phosphorylase